MTGSPDKTLKLRVSERTLIADRILSLVLTGVDERVLPVWEPGAHIELVLPNGQSRQYSLCGHPEQHDSYEIAVQREAELQSRGGSIYIHDRLRAGDIVHAGLPHNNFALEPAARYHFVAGGIGITPLVPMLERATSDGIPWSLIYGARTRSALAFLPRLVPHGERVNLLPENERGVPDLEAVLADVGPEELLYVCGPSPLLSALRAAAEAAGREEAIRFELFSSPVGEVPAAAENEAFEVVLQRSGFAVEVGPNETVLDRLVAAGVPIFSDCEEGICGSCECPVLEGEIEHRDHVLNQADRDAGRTMMVCVSRARGRRLVLDI